MRNRLPKRRACLTFEVGEGSQKIYVSVGEYNDGTPGEIFLESNKEGSFTKSVLHALALAISLGMQHGVSVEQFHHSFRLIGDEGDFLKQIFQTIREEYGVKTNA